MKKIIAALISIVFIAIPAIAEIDLSSMTFNDLLDLQKQVQLAMMQTDEWQEVTVPGGTYKVGEDIPVGKWKISARGNSMVSVEYGSKLGEGGVGIDYLSAYDIVMLADPDGFYGSLGGQGFVVWNLVDGTYIEISGGNVIFTPYTGASFSFK